MAGPAERLLRLGERLLSLLVEAGRTRAELLAVEFAVEKVRLVQFIAMGLIFSLCLLLGLTFASMLIIVCFWDTHRLAAIAAVTAFYAVVAIIMASMMMRRLKDGPPPFVNTLDTLHRDYTAMQKRLRRAKSSDFDGDDTAPGDLPDIPQSPLPKDPS
jgi:uncharacterized membrane protein YqjE